MWNDDAMRVHALVHNSKKRCKGINLLALDIVFAPTVYFIHSFSHHWWPTQKNFYFVVYTNEKGAKWELRYEKLRRHEIDTLSVYPRIDPDLWSADAAAIKFIFYVLLQILIIRR